MLASDLQVPLPVVQRETTALEAARQIARDRLFGLVIADAAGTPVAVVSSADVLRLMIPPYLLADCSLAGVLDEQSAGEVWGGASTRTIGDLLDDDDVPVRELLHVNADDTLVELAVAMVDRRTQVAVVDGPAGGGFVTLPAVVDAILARHDGAGGGAA